MDGWRGHARSILSPLSKRVLTKAFRRLTMTVQQNLNVSRERWWRRTAQLSHCEAAALSDRLPLANNRKPPQLRALCSTNDTRIIPLHRPQQHGQHLLPEFVLENATHLDDIHGARQLIPRQLVIDGNQFTRIGESIPRSFVSNRFAFTRVDRINRSSQFITMLFYFSVVIISGGEFHRENLLNLDKRGSVEKHRVSDGDPVSLKFPSEKNNRDTVSTSH